MESCVSDRSAIQGQCFGHDFGSGAQCDGFVSVVASTGSMGQLRQRGSVL